ncbi:MAG: enoyl-CoA hydratase [Deltaproteobacteria bacterium]|nr:enoyl-CoA hydratase [Deltaproteobacteria bacterium]
MSRPIAAGERLATRRTYTAAEVAAFAELTLDTGRHHVQADPEGRVMVHGLLVAALPTQLGGELHYLAREMRFEFLRPVFTGDTIEAELVVLRADPAPDRFDVELEVVCRNQAGKEVLRGASRGIIRR